MDPMTLPFHVNLSKDAVHGGDTFDHLGLPKAYKFQLRHLIEVIIASPDSTVVLGANGANQ